MEMRPRAQQPKMEEIPYLDDDAVELIEEPLMKQPEPSVRVRGEDWDEDRGAPKREGSEQAASKETMATLVENVREEMKNWSPEKVGAYLKEVGGRLKKGWNALTQAEEIELSWEEFEERQYIEPDLKFIGRRKLELEGGAYRSVDVEHVVARKLTAIEKIRERFAYYADEFTQVMTVFIFPDELTGGIGEEARATLKKLLKKVVEPGREALEEAGVLAKQEKHEQEKSVLEDFKRLMPDHLMDDDAWLWREVMKNIGYMLDNNIFGRGALRHLQRAELSTKEINDVIRAWNENVMKGKVPGGRSADYPALEPRKPVSVRFVLPSNVELHATIGFADLDEPVLHFEPVKEVPTIVEKDRFYRWNERNNDVMERWKKMNEFLLDYEFVEFYHRSFDLDPSRGYLQMEPKDHWKRLNEMVDRVNTKYAPSKGAKRIGEHRMPLIGGKEIVVTHWSGNPNGFEVTLER